MLNGLTHSFREFSKWFSNKERSKGGRKIRVWAIQGPPTSCSYNLLSSCLHIFITTLVLRIPMKVFLGLCFAQEPLCLPLFPDSVTTSSPWTCTTVVDAAWLSWVVGPLLHLPSIPPPPLLLTQHSTPLLAPKVHSSVSTGQDTGRGS